MTRTEKYKDFRKALEESINKPTINEQLKFVFDKSDYKPKHAKEVK